jgi:hypothetical protein
MKAKLIIPYLLFGGFWHDAYACGWTVTVDDLPGKGYSKVYQVRVDGEFRVLDLPELKNNAHCVLQGVIRSEAGLGGKTPASETVEITCSGEQPLKNGLKMVGIRATSRDDAPTEAHLRLGVASQDENGFGHGYDITIECK